MITTWTTVINWQYNVATLICQPSSSCDNCTVKPHCGINISKKYHLSDLTLEVVSLLPLIPGQLVEIGISASNFLYYTFLFYILPLVGFISGAVLLQMIFDTNQAAVWGAIVGGIASWWCTRVIITQNIVACCRQVVILQVLPPYFPWSIDRTTNHEIICYINKKFN